MIVRLAENHAPSLTEVRFESREYPNDIKKILEQVL